MEIGAEDGILADFGIAPRVDVSVRGARGGGCREWTAKFDWDW